MTTKHANNHEHGKNRKAEDRIRNLSKKAKKEAIQEQRYN